MANVSIQEGKIVISGDVSVTLDFATARQVYELMNAEYRREDVIRVLIEEGYGYTEEDFEPQNITHEMSEMLDILVTESFENEEDDDTWRQWIRSAVNKYRIEKRTLRLPTTETKEE